MYHTRIIYLLIAMALLTACATNPSGRNQLLLIGDGEMNQMGLTAFQQMKTSDKLSADPAKTIYVECIMRSLVQQLAPEFQGLPWEVAIFKDQAANAFALPGGKVGVHTGMLALASTADEMAAVLSHEIAHVSHRHGSERVSQQMAAQVGLAASEAYVGRKTSPEQTRNVMALMGVGAQLGIILPFSRQHESEADTAGQILMARAGFNPAAAISLWQKMGAENLLRSPQFLATHPDPDQRIHNLTERMQNTLPLYKVARQQGRRPLCVAPILNKAKDDKPIKPG